MCFCFSFIKKIKNKNEEPKITELSNTTKINRFLCVRYNAFLCIPLNSPCA